MGKTTRLEWKLEAVGEDLKKREILRNIRGYGHNADKTCFNCSKQKQGWCHVDRNPRQLAGNLGNITCSNHPLRRGEEN